MVSSKKYLFKPEWQDPLFFDRSDRIGKHVAAVTHVKSHLLSDKHIRND